MGATTTYSEMYAQFKRDIGVGSNYTEDGELSARFNGWFNDRLREIWRAARWSQCVCVEPCIVCTDGVVPIPCVVDNGDKLDVFIEDPRSNYAPKRADFILNDGWLWVGQKRASQLNESAPTAFSGKAFSNCKAATLNKGDLLFQKQWQDVAVYVYRTYRYAAETSIDIAEGSAIDQSKIGTDWLAVADPNAVLTPIVWILYKSISPNFNENGVDSVTNLAVAIPMFMKRYVQLAVHSDYLRSLNRQDEAEKVFDSAQVVLSEEIYKFEVFSTKGEDVYGKC